MSKKKKSKQQTGQPTQSDPSRLVADAMQANMQAANAIMSASMDYYMDYMRTVTSMYRPPKN